MISDDRDEGTIRKTCLLKTVENPAENAVGISELQEMFLKRFVDERR